MLNDSVAGERSAGALVLACQREGAEDPDKGNAKIMCQQGQRATECESRWRGSAEGEKRKKSMGVTVIGMNRERGARDH